jgi:hypothetical protein
LRSHRASSRVVVQVGASANKPGTATGRTVTRYNPKRSGSVSMLTVQSATGKFIRRRVATAAASAVVRRRNSKP